jgi:hypothetical protein
VSAVLSLCLLCNNIVYPANKQNNAFDMRAMYVGLDQDEL